MALQPSGSARVYLESGWSVEYEGSSCSPCHLDIKSSCLLAVEATSTADHRGILVLDINEIFAQLITILRCIFVIFILAKLQTISTQTLTGSARLFWNRLGTQLASTIAIGRPPFCRLTRHSTTLPITPTTSTLPQSSSGRKVTMLMTLCTAELACAIVRNAYT